ncbi:hypothetical protein TBLA_0C05100 [Henningerozyma blattae CBS 6284]|uniref:Histone acetyltransferase n=1 Tax=Henningerozyma blattae (strain ATCC 34711 / CBS 6284 / DSM 70876 / NBRC 10599 / NRRL Y-10934 / UCD 77-7) TaxID=1071380 RepID=I2H1Q4_HENB6|nr:hypothetical protein TBLA_0C05100 [Tetrapisispora blattae CBS 6284]CCH60306.1 hypothetical protein TBLA_0C05100 [Tetrapisispora blattae CBS 6284]
MTPLPRFLRNLQIDDNVHSGIAAAVLRDPDARPAKRPRHVTATPQPSKSPDVLVPQQLPEHVHSLNPELADTPSAENAGDSRYNTWRLPQSRAEADALSDYVLFPRTIARSHSLGKDYNPNVVGLKYDPHVFFNFHRLARVRPKQREIEERQRLSDKSRDAKHHVTHHVPRTIPSRADRRRFRRLLTDSLPASNVNTNVPLTNIDNPITNISEFTSSDGIQYVYLDDREIKTWFRSPFPPHLNRNKLLFVCQHCLRYTGSRYAHTRHRVKCPVTFPPGNEVYRDGILSIWEVDGREQVRYCRALCLLARLFLHSKTLYYDVEPFIFYVLTERAADGKCRLVGYFSQEKLSAADYNLSCILVLPTYQRRGYGHFLIDFSYLLSRRSFKWGTPEKPLSDLGLLSYRSFWTLKVCQTLQMLKPLAERADDGDDFNITLELLANLTGMLPVDIVFGLEQLQLLYHKPTSHKYSIRINDWQIIDSIVDRWNAKGYATLDPTKLLWKPMIFGPSCGVNAVGTIETSSVSTPANPNIFVNKPTSPDPFKKSIEMLVNFMQDDLADPRTMERSTLDTLINNPIITTSEFYHPGEWKLCFIQPQLNHKDLQLSRKRYKSKRQLIDEEDGLLHTDDDTSSLTDVNIDSNI